VFHSSSGGSTEASGDLWAQQLPYLVQVPDFDDHSPVHRWQERFEAQQLRQLFADIGGVQAITVSDRSAGGRVRRIRLEGPRGVLSLTGAELRRRLGLRSTWIEVELIQPFALARPAADATQDQGSQAMPALGQASQEPDAGAQAAGQQPSIPPPPPLPGAPASLSQAPLAGLLIRGRGFGHGVGMSQWGAHGLALRGASHTAILSHYYPGTQLHAYRDP
jgi:stage II sporulation protein D